MDSIFSNPFFGIAISIIAYIIGLNIKKRLKSAIFNPLIIAIIIIMAILLIFDISYDDYKIGGDIINMFLIPSTACLAISIYNNIKILKDNWFIIVFGSICGSLGSLISVYVLCKLFNLDDIMISSLLAKSITTPMAISVTESFNGVVPITVVAVIITGIMGSILAPLLIKILRLQDKMVIGLAIGASSHAVGTSKAIEMGEIEGAMSGLAIGICGITTFIFALFISF